MAKERILKYPISDRGANVVPGHSVKDVVWSPRDKSIVAYTSTHVGDLPESSHVTITLIATGENYDSLDIIGIYRKAVVCPEIGEVWHVFY